MVFFFLLRRFTPFLVLGTCLFSLTGHAFLYGQVAAPGFHLTARPWHPLNTSADRYLDAIEGMVRVAARFQDSTGAIIDPYLGREHQYSTPYFAHALGTLLAAGRAQDLFNAGKAAMRRALADFSKGFQHIPDAHGEFYVAALAEAVALYRPWVDDATYRRWVERASTPLDKVMRDQTGRLNNWRTYAMKGEWLRAQKGWVDREDATAYIEHNWLHHTQRERIQNDKFHLYQDWSSDPQSHAVEAVGRGNLTALALNGYDGPSAEHLRRRVRQGGRSALLLQSPAGQCPPNGRTDNHVFNDILYQLIFESLAEDAWTQGDSLLAGQYRRAALLAFQSILRWQRKDPPWKGSFYITKNFYDPGRRVGYQPASQWGNYSGAMMFHLAEAYHTRRSPIPEYPSPVEIGGYAFQTDAGFGTFVANAGGMQVFVNLRGDEVPKYGVYWTPLGTVRFSRVAWDDRLGPGDGARHPGGGPRQGLTFGPAWQEAGRWVHLADMARDYRGFVQVDMVHPLLVKFTLTYTYVTGKGGPYFQQEFVLTPDGVLTRLRSLQPQPFALTLPLLVEDGRPLDVRIDGRMVSTGYHGAPDRQYFLGLNEDLVQVAGDSAIQGTYGTLQPILFSTQDSVLQVFVYPRGAGDPEGAAVMDSFRFTQGGFQSVLATVTDSLYIGKTCAGGIGSSLDLDGDQQPDLTFDQSCSFVLHHLGGRISAIEVDRPVTLRYEGRTQKLEAFQVLENP